MVIFASHVGKIVQIAFKRALRGKSYKILAPDNASQLNFTLRPGYNKRESSVIPWLTSQLADRPGQGRDTP